MVTLKVAGVNHSVSFMYLTVRAVDVGVRPCIARRPQTWLPSTEGTHWWRWTHKAA